MTAMVEALPNTDPCWSCRTPYGRRKRHLCTTCYEHYRYRGELWKFPKIPPVPPKPKAEPQRAHLAICPRCSDGGMATTYQAVDGRATHYICLARSHSDAQRIFSRSEART